MELHASLILDMHGTLSLGIHRPACGYDEACLHESGGQGIPGTNCLVSEHEDHNRHRP